jgi:hypothetical protein
MEVDDNVEGQMWLAPSATPTMATREGAVSARGWGMDSTIARW